MAAPSRVIGNYELHSELAAGGMATVYLGRRKNAQDVVAIKRLHEHLTRDPDLPSVLLEEGRITKRIAHPNVVATLDVVREGAELLLIMEYVHGETVARLLRVSQEKEQRCPIPIAAAIMHGVLLGLQAAHETRDEQGNPLQIVHRDISPQNIMVGALDGVPRLLDFGIAKAVGAQIHTRTGELKGKIPYMAPEILSFEKATPKSDVWGAAIVLWELLCGRRLFKGESEVHVWGLVLSGPIPPVAEILGAPTPLDAVMNRALNRDRAAGYSTAAELAHDIASAVVPLASPTEIREWVDSLAHASLEERKVAFTTFESTLRMHAPAVKALADKDDDDDLVTTTSPSARQLVSAAGPGVVAGPAQERRSSRSLVLFGAILAIAAGVFAIWAWQYNVKQRSALASPSPPSVPSPSLSAAEEPPVVSSNAPTPPPPPTSSVVAAAASSAKRAAGLPPPKARLPAGKPASCDPPYVIDSAGRKIFKLECVANEK